MRQLTLGDFELTLLSDGHYYADGGAMFGVIPRVLWEQRIRPDERNRIEMGLNSLLIRDGRHTVLVETGIGPKLPDKERRIYDNEAQLLRNFEEAGVSPEEVDVVINTHLHFDHCGYNTYYDRDGRPKPAFPRARYYVQRGEWKHAQNPNPRDYVSYKSDNYNPLIESGQMELITGDREIVPGVSVRLYPGHTRDMQAVLVRSGGRTACYISDLIPTTNHLDIAWCMGYDSYPVEVMEQKQRFYTEAIPERWLVIFTHDHFRPWGYVEQDARGKHVLTEAASTEAVSEVSEVPQVSKVLKAG